MRRNGRAEGGRAGMARLSAPRYAAGSTEALIVRPCEMCGSESDVTGFATSREGRKPRVRLAICVDCMMFAAERRTDMSFGNQYRQWSRMRAATRLGVPKKGYNRDK